MALDYLLAATGGTCALIGSECCTYIPDSSDNITDLAEHIGKMENEIRAEGRKFKGYNPPGWWPFGSLFGDWGGMLIHAGIIILVVCLLIGLQKYVCQCIKYSRTQSPL